MAFNEKVSTPLCEIMGRYGSDKGSVNILSSWHNYTTYYYSIFKDLKDKSPRIFELGLGTNNIALPSKHGKGWSTRCIASWMGRIFSPSIHLRS